MYSSLESNEGTNLTNEPFCAQANDARHEIINKAGQNLFKGETVEVFRKSFTVVDDIAAIHAKMFDYAGMTTPRFTETYFMCGFIIVKEYLKVRLVVTLLIMTERMEKENI